MQLFTTTSTNRINKGVCSYSIRSQIEIRQAYNGEQKGGLGGVLAK